MFKHILLCKSCPIWHYPAPCMAHWNRDFRYDRDREPFSAASARQIVRTNAWQQKKRTKMVRYSSLSTPSTRNILYPSFSPNPPFGFGILGGATGAWSCIVLAPGSGFADVFDWWAPYFKSSSANEESGSAVVNLNEVLTFDFCTELGY